MVQTSAVFRSRPLRPSAIALVGCELRSASAVERVSRFVRRRAYSESREASRGVRRGSVVDGSVGGGAGGVVDIFVTCW